MRKSLFKNFVFAFLFALVLAAPVFAVDSSTNYENQMVINDVPTMVNIEPIPSPTDTITKTEKIKYENRSVKPEDVISKYPIGQDKKNELIYLHNEIAIMKSNEEALERYENLYNNNPTDYLAAYYAGKRSFDMAKYGRASGWCKRAIEINPNYTPAKQLLKKADKLKDF